MSPTPQETADLVTFTEEILNGNLNFLRSISCNKFMWHLGEALVVLIII